MSITRKKFERTYSAELLPSSMANYSLGDVWDWERRGLNWRLTFLVYNIAEIFNDMQLLNKLQSVERVQANLPEIEMTSDFKADVNLNIPALNLNIGNVIKNESVRKFSFTNVEGKNTLGFKNAIDEALEALKLVNYQKYKDDIRDCEIAVQFFYAGSVVLEVDRTVSDTAELKAKFNEQGIEFKAEVAVGNVEKFTINSSSCPFAAQFIKGKDL